MSEHSHIEAGLPQFCADSPPASETNRRAARAHHLRYNPKKRAYIDAEGALVRDRFGQRY